VFLPIPKCISYPDNYGELPETLATISDYNYILSNIWNAHKANYYTLLYPKNISLEEKTDFLLDLLIKIE
jgi:hypothetical protein